MNAILATLQYFDGDPVDVDKKGGGKTGGRVAKVPPVVGPDTGLPLFLGTVTDPRWVPSPGPRSAVWRGADIPVGLLRPPVCLLRNTVGSRRLRRWAVPLGVMVVDTDAADARAVGTGEGPE